MEVLLLLGRSQVEKDHEKYGEKKEGGGRECMCENPVPVPVKGTWYHVSRIPTEGKES